MNTVSPGYMDTAMVRAVPAEILDGIIGQIPVGRLGKTDEIAAMVRALGCEPEITEGESAPPPGESTRTSFSCPRRARDSRVFWQKPRARRIDTRP